MHEDCPMTQEAPLFIFDWDNTLFPTSWQEKAETYSLHDKDQAQHSALLAEQLQEHGKVIRATLTAASNLGHVVLVTLASRSWLQTSAEMFLPELDLGELSVQLGVQIYHAREHVTRSELSALAAEDELGVSVCEKIKQRAIQRALKNHYRSMVKSMHVICVGDSMAEINAITDIMWCSSDKSNNICKTVKFLSEPSIDDLTMELNILMLCFKAMLSRTTDLHVTMNDVSILGLITDEPEDVEGTAKLCAAWLCLQVKLLSPSNLSGPGMKQKSVSNASTVASASCSSLSESYQFSDWLASPY